jgi:hypothetical protein
MEKAANYYEPLMRARIARGMRALRKQVSVADIAAAILSHRTQLFRPGEVAKTLEPAKKVRRDAFRRGGQLGAEKVAKALR